MTSALLHLPPAHRLFTGDIPASLRDDFARAERISWDIETSGLDWSGDRIALCQLYAENIPVAIIRIGSELPQNLCSLLADANVTKVFHHAMFDLRFMAHHWSVRPQNIACTKIASKLLFPGEPEEQTLQRLLSSILGIQIDKTERMSNWFAAAYSSAQLAYAAADVIHLADLLDVLVADLAAKGLLELAEHCFEHIPTRVELETGGFGDVFQY